ncbi:MAG: molybdenum cofactor guanylyltransferase [Thermoanaerobaculia bacterium]
MKIPMPAAVLAGGASRRMGVSKTALPWGGMTLLEHQTGRLAELFTEVFVVGKEDSRFEAGPARILWDRSPQAAPIHGLVRALEETKDHLFALALDLPALSADLIREIARRGLETRAPALLPEDKGVLQPLAAVWRRGILPLARDRIARGELSLHGLAQAAGAEILRQEQWRALDSSGNSFANLNTFEEYLAARERA